MKENTKDIYKMAYDAMHRRNGNIKTTMKKMVRMGWSVSDIARAFGMSEDSVSRILNSRG